MNDFAGIVDVNLAIEAKTFGQFAHAYIFGHIDRDHALDSTLACHLDQVAHEERAEALVLPFITNGHGTFTAFAIFGDAEAAHTDLSFLAGIVAQRDKRHVALVVEVRQFPDQIVPDRTLAQEPIFPRLRRQALDECALQRAIVLADWTDQYTGAVAKFIVPVRGGIDAGHRFWVRLANPRCLA